MLLVCLLAAGYAAAQRPFARDFWLNDNSIPVRVNALAQDAAGYLWVGTDAGLYYYNRETFIRIPDTTRAPVTALAIADSTVWVGYKNGQVARLRQDHPEAYHPAIPSGAAITALYPAAGQSLIAATEDKLQILLPQATISVGEAQGLPDNFIYAYVPLSPTRALIASDKGLSDVTLNQGHLQVYNVSTSNGLPDAILRVVRQIPGTPRCWLGTQQGGVALYDTALRRAWVPPYEGSWQWGEINDILPVATDKAWVSTATGYLLGLTLSGSGQLHIEAYAYPGKTLGSLLMDKSGTLWCGTGEGLMKTTAGYTGYIPLDAPYALSRLTAMAYDKTGRLWLAQDRQLYALSPAGAMKTPMLIHNAEANITSLYADEANRLWIGTLGKGLWYRTPADGRMHRTGIDSLQEENILSIAGTPGCLWIAGLTGVREIAYPDAEGRQQLIRHHTKASGIGTDYVYQIYPDRQNRIWMATDGAGVSRYDHPGYHNWSGQSGMNSKVAYSITEDADGDIWATTLEGGLYRYHNDRWRPITRDDGLQDQNISALSATRAGQVVVVNRRNVDVWYPGSRQFRHFDRRLDVELDSTSAVLNCITRDAAGNVYVPFEHGIIMFRNDAARYDVKPDLRITRASLFLSPEAARRYAFRYNENYLSFYYDGINYTNPGRLNYRYMLRGYNNRWIETMDRSATFPNLPPGRYEFRVQVSMSRNFEGAREAAYAFTIASPIWKRAWFIGAALLLAGLLGYLLVRRRDQRVNNMLRLQQERLLFEYEHLKSQVNPHFLFNSLNTLTGLIEEDNRQSAVKYTEQLTELYRNMLAYRDRYLILLSEEWDILSAYLYIQQGRFGNALQVVADIPAEVLRQKQIVPMALQLLVENAIKHNIVSRSAPLVISITADEAQITVSNPLHAKLSKEKGAGLGLENIRRRYELLTKRKVTYGVADGRYVVTLPLL